MYPVFISKGYPTTFVHLLESNHFKILEVQLLCPTDSSPYSLSDFPQTSCACAPVVLHMLKKFQVNPTKIKGGCQSDTKAEPQESWSDLTLGRKHIWLPEISM